jgi:hypothetical protein
MFTIIELYSVSKTVLEIKGTELSDLRAWNTKWQVNIGIETNCSLQQLRQLKYQ